MYRDTCVCVHLYSVYLLDHRHLSLLVKCFPPPLQHRRRHTELSFEMLHFSLRQPCQHKHFDVQYWNEMECVLMVKNMQQIFALVCTGFAPLLHTHNRQMPYTFFFNSYINRSFFFFVWRSSGYCRLLGASLHTQDYIYWKAIWRMCQIVTATIWTLRGGGRTFPFLLHLIISKIQSHFTYFRRFIMPTYMLNYAMHGIFFIKKGAPLWKCW